MPRLWDHWRGKYLREMERVGYLRFEMKRKRKGKVKKDRKRLDRSRGRMIIGK